MQRDTIPFLDVSRPGFSTRSDDMKQARKAFWCARTPFGLAILRHRQAGELLRDKRLRQGSYAWPDTCGLTGSFAEFWKRSVIALEGTSHKEQRRAAQAALNEDAIRALEPQFTALAQHLLDRLRSGRDFDFLAGFSQPYAARAIGILLDLDEDTADTMGRDASTLGLAMGIDAKIHESAVNAAADRLMDLARILIGRVRDGTDKTGFTARLMADADLPDQAIEDLIVISIFGGVDTTRAQLAFAMALFAEHPRQWTALKANPDRIPAAIEEVIRTRPTTTWSTREAVEDIPFGGITIQKGETLHIWVNATGTDPAIDADTGFDVTTTRKSHFGFGGGAHHCLGHFVARTDMACALRVLVENWREIHLSATPAYLPDSGNTSPRSMPLRPVWEALG